MRPEFAALHACPQLFFGGIEPHGERGIRLTLLEARSDGRQDDGILASVESLPSQAIDAPSEPRTIAHGPNCKVFELTWTKFVAFSIEDESLSTRERNPQLGERRVFRESTDSAYLNYVATSTRGSLEADGPFRHWMAACLDYSANVVAQDEPELAISDYVEGDDE